MQKKTTLKISALPYSKIIEWAKRRAEMLSDVAIQILKPKEKPYTVTDRGGMYVLVSTTGTGSFRLDYRLNGRRETVVLGRHDKAGISLA
jgi:hypothetical protein